MACRQTVYKALSAPIMTKFADTHVDTDGHICVDRLNELNSQIPPCLFRNRYKYVPVYALGTHIADDMANMILIFPPCRGYISYLIQWKGVIIMIATWIHIVT